MRLTYMPLLTVMLTAISTGCGGKPGHTSTPDTPGPKTHSITRTGTPVVSTPTGRTPKETGSVPSDSKGKMQVEITKGKLKINGIVVPLRAELAGFEQALGKPTRTSERGVYRGVYWKELGISCLQDKTGKQDVISINFNFDGYWDFDESYKSKPFTGAIILESQPISKDTDPDELMKKVSILKKLDGVHLTIQYEDKTTILISTLLKGITEVTIEKLN